MQALTAAELQTRLMLDRDLVDILNADPSAPVTLTGHRSITDAAGGQGALGQGPPAPTAYRAVYDVPTLTGPDQPYRGQTVVVFDLLGNGNYPFTEPVARVVGPVPWTPHFEAGRVVCIGHTIWAPAGTTTAAELIVHVGRLLNFDEPPNGGLTGWNVAAIQWWRQYGSRPLDPSLVWPNIDPNRNAGRTGSVRRTARRPSRIRTAVSASSPISSIPAAGTTAGIRTVSR